jgi:hypothetical protein
MGTSHNFSVQSVLYTIFNDNDDGFIHLVAGYQTFTGFSKTALRCC